MERLVILTESQLKEVVSKTIQDSLKPIRENAETGVQKEWLTNKEVCEMLSITLKTMQNHRDKGMIPFSKIGSRIYYRKEDISAFLKSNYICGFNRKGGRYDK